MKKSDRILFGKRSGAGVRIDGKEPSIVKGSDVMDALAGAEIARKVA